jgi:type IV secretory pathway VirB4 component
MFGLDLYDRSLIKSPTVIVTAASGEGKSFLATMLITDIRAHRGQVKVRVMDYRYSFKPICRLFNGRHIEFNEREPKPINIWNYPGIETGKTPTKRQLAMVLTDILILSKTPRIDAITSAIASTVIDEVYKMATARNGEGRPKFQPTLGHFLDVLKTYHWQDAQKARADELYLKLNIYRKDPWLNAPTHPDYDQNSMFDVFELSTISQLDEKVRESVGFRISAQIMQEIGEEDENQQKTPILFICDEVREINKHFPAIQELMAEASVTGRKEGLVTILFSQAYEHFTGTIERPNVSGIDLVKNSGVKIIGKQIGGFERLADDCELSKETIAAVRAINNHYGSYTQWLMVLGSGNDKIIEMAEVHASPTMLWANTNDTNEANARRLIENLRPDLPLAFIVSWLAGKYPRGLTAAGLTNIFERDLAELQTGGLT